MRKWREWMPRVLFESALIVFSVFANREHLLGQAYDSALAILNRAPQ